MLIPYIGHVDIRLTRKRDDLDATYSEQRLAAFAKLRTIPRRLDRTGVTETSTRSHD